MSRHAAMVLPTVYRSTFVPPVEQVDAEVEETCS